MNFASVKSLIIPEGSVYQILSGSTVLWTKSGETPPTPVFSYLEIDGTKSYTLDYQITTGYEMAIADIEYNQTWSFYSDKRKWSKMIGIHDSDLSSKKWFLGAYRGGSLNPGTQFGSSGDRTLTISDESSYSLTFYNQRLLWKYGWGFLQVYTTEGNWEEGREVGDAIGGKTESNKWSELIGRNISVGGITYDARWTNIFLFRGLRIYSEQDNGTLLADYDVRIVNGVTGIYNNITGTFNTGS